jgi:hypothetical protein
MKRAMRQAWVYGSLEDDDKAAARSKAQRKPGRARKRRSSGTIFVWLFVAFVVLVAISNTH